MTTGLPYDFDRGPRALRRAHRDHDRRRPTRPRPRWRASSAPSRGYERERRAHAARHPQPSPRRAWRGRRLRGPRAPTRCRSTTPPARTRASSSTPSAAWDRALALGEKHGYRNAQATVIAPTGTIGLVMDCDTTGIEPDFALVKFKKLAGGGYFKIINRAVPDALRALGYREARDRRDRGLCGRPRLAAPGARRSTTATLRAKGFTDEKIEAVEKGLKSRLRHQVRLQQVDARRGLPDAAR